MSVWKEEELTCKPLDTYNEILSFLQDPPPWRTLCEELRPHSHYKIKNSDLISKSNNLIANFVTDTFCHNSPDADIADDVERHEDKKVPKTLVCHDMANGYHDDCIIDGTGNYEAYMFYNWAGIDIFCYFSHHLITIPPLGWINVAHSHGVKVIGTVITEWADGVGFWDKILKSEQQYKEFASALVVIAKTLKFDGWLLNVENKISKPEDLLAFVKHLHHIMHQELPNPVLIWYDSVTIDGHLNWQNALNSKNKPFFDACDGLFTNYSWTEKEVVSSAVAAGERLTDLYIGLDVWGRNFYGGGKFNLHEAVNVAYSYGCSLAIFAPAWTHEAITTDKNDVNTVSATVDLDKYGQFLLRDRAMWDSIWQYLNTNLPSHLPFKTSFCRGQGKKRRLYGEVLCPVAWYNLRHMQYQPNSSHGPHGYILTSHDEILRISKHGFPKDSKGIIKFRDAIQASHHHVHPSKSIEDVTLIPKKDSVDHLKDNVKENTIEQDQPSTEDGSHSRPNCMKRKMKNLFKHMFKKKTLRNDDSVKAIEPHQVDDDHENEDEIDRASTLDSDKVQTRGSCSKSNEPDKRVEFLQEDRQFQEILNVSENCAQTLQMVVENDEEDVNTLTRRSMVQMSVNINLGQTNKIRYGLIHVPDELQCLEVYFDDSFIGGSCLKVNPSDKCSSDHRTIRLLHCDFFCEDTLIVCVVTKNCVGLEEQFLNLKLYTKDVNDGKHVVNLVGRNVPTSGIHQEEKEFSIINVYPVIQGSDEFRQLQKYLLLNEPGFYVAVENSYHWIVRYYQVTMPRMRVTSINCAAGLHQGPILLGHLALCHMPSQLQD